MKYQFFSCIIVLVYAHLVEAVVVGSNTVVSRQGSITFPSADTDNEIRGFAVMESGFALTNSVTTCTFNAFFPVGSTVTLNNGTLSLNEPLYFMSNVQLSGGGSIIGNQKTITLPSRATDFIISGTVSVSNTTIICNGPISLTGTLLFKGNCAVEGNGNTITYNSGALVIDNGASVILTDLSLINLHTGGLYCRDSLGTVSLQEVEIVQDNTYSFTQGAFDIVGDVMMRGEKVFAYTSSKKSTVYAHATWSFDAGMTFSYAPASTSKTLISCIDKTSVLHFFETSLVTTTTGWQLTKGSIVFEGICPLMSDAIQSSQGLIFGDGVSSANDVVVSFLPESQLHVISGFVSYKNIS